MAPTTDETVSANVTAAVIPALRPGVIGDDSFPRWSCQDSPRPLPVFALRTPEDGAQWAYHSNLTRQCLDVIENEDARRLAASQPLHCQQDYAELGAVEVIGLDH